MGSTLSVIVPSYNARDLLERALRTLRQSLDEAAIDAEVLVVDGQSSDQSLEMVRREFPWARTYSHANHGFGHAVNRGLEHASSDRLLLLNSDLFISKDALLAMLARLAAEPEVGAVAPMLQNLDGSRQHVFGVFGALYLANWVPVRQPTAVPMLSFACLMTRRDVLLEVGAFDENLFLYNEEYEWCARARQAGYRLEILPTSVVHVGGGSTTRSPELLLEEQRGFMYFAEKHTSPLVTQCLRGAMVFEAYVAKRLDPRPRHRSMWARLESLVRRKDYLDSPFQLSGRGDGPAQPHWVGVDRSDTEPVLTPSQRVA